MRCEFCGSSTFQAGKAGKSVRAGGRNVTTPRNQPPALKNRACAPAISILAFYVMRCEFCGTSTFKAGKSVHAGWRSATTPPDHAPGFEECCPAAQQFPFLLFMRCEFCGTSTFKAGKSVRAGGRSATTPPDHAPGFEECCPAAQQKNSAKEDLPNWAGPTSLPNYFADAVWTAGGKNSWLRAATQ